MLRFWLPVLCMLPPYCLTLLAGYLVYRRSASGELARKIIHLTAVLISVSHFYVFSSPWQSYVAGTFFFIFLIVIRFTRPGFFLFRIKRKSLGDLLLLLGLGIPVLFGRRDVVISITTMLVLGISDSLAALIGQTGKRLLLVYNHKTIRGSLAFLVSAFIILCCGTVVYHGGFTLNLLLISGLTALGVTVVEAVSTRGIDNILIPLCVFLLLKSGLQSHIIFSLSLTGFLLLAVILAVVFVFIQHQRGGLDDQV